MYPEKRRACQRRKNLNRYFYTKVMQKNRSCEVRSGHIEYTRQGKGPVLVLLHPIGMDMTWWQDYVRDWQSEYDVLAIDLRGHGSSSLIDAPMTLSRHAADVTAVLNQEAIASAHVLGVSMGGMVAQCLAIDAPTKVSSVILCATAATFPDEARPRILARGDMGRAGKMSEVTEETIGRWFQADTPRPDLVEACRTRLLSDDWYSWSANWKAISELDNLVELAAVQSPTLVVASECDQSIPVAASARIADTLPNARIVSVPGAAHFGAFDKVDKFKPIFDQFLCTVAHRH